MGAGLGAVLTWLLVKESPKFYASRGREEECLKVLREIFVHNTGKDGKEYPVSNHFIWLIYTNFIEIDRTVSKKPTLG